MVRIVLDGETSRLLARLVLTRVAASTRSTITLSTCDVESEAGKCPDPSTGGFAAQRLVTWH